MKHNRDNKTTRNILGFLYSVSLLLVSCSFNYSELEENTSRYPDLLMSDLDYVRVRDGKAVLRFQAETAARFEEEQLMRLQYLSFEQYSSDGVDAAGQAGQADMELNTGNSRLDGAVNIVVPSEELSIETSALFWDDESNMLYGDKDASVLIKQSDGSILQGTGFFADVRRRSWSFDTAVSGSYYEEDEEKAIVQSNQTTGTEAIP